MSILEMPVKMDRGLSPMTNVIYHVAYWFMYALKKHERKKIEAIEWIGFISLILSSFLRLHFSVSHRLIN
jgi:hypothetical protein